MVRGSLPPAVELAVRMSSVAPHVRAMFESLTQPIRVDAVLDEGRVPPTALALLKLGLLLEDRVRIGDVEIGTPTRLVVSLGERRCHLDGDALGHDLRTLARRILPSLFEGSDVAHLLESFAFQTSSLFTLQRITNHMLGATDIDRALYVMLSGLTSGHGLAFNRAALFVRDEATGALHGKKAIGPADDQEAHRIWEAIELEEKTLEQTIADTYAGNFDTRFQKRVETIVLAPGAGDEIDDALASTEPVLVHGAARSPGLQELEPPCGFVLSRVSARGRVLGLVFADNRYARAAVTPEQIAHFGFYTDQTALVWENLSLLARVEALARTDSLTGVLNRREFEARFESERSRCQRSSASCSLFLIDVDRFKEINDTNGHAAGDVVLRRLGALLARQLREHDVAARLGGDEFAVLLPDASREQLVRVVRRFGALARSEGISLSIGGATWPGDSPDLDALLGAADAQLYAAKRAGRGCAFVGDERIVYMISVAPPAP